MNKEKIKAALGFYSVAYCGFQKDAAKAMYLRYCKESNIEPRDDFKEHAKEIHANLLKDIDVKGFYKFTKGI